MGYRQDVIPFEPKLRPISLVPINDYRFPKPRSEPGKLDRPRPPGKDVLEWLLEGSE